jgi:hypothetical protein
MLARNHHHHHDHNPKVSSLLLFTTIAVVMRTISALIVSLRPSRTFWWPSSHLTVRTKTAPGRTTAGQNYKQPESV